MPLEAESQSLYSSVVERQSCKLKVLGSIPSGGFFEERTFKNLVCGDACRCVSYRCCAREFAAQFWTRARLNPEFV